MRKKTILPLLIASSLWILAKARIGAKEKQLADINAIATENHPFIQEIFNALKWHW